MTNSQNKFRVRQSTVVDPTWEVGKAIDLWERMLASRLRTLAGASTQEQKEGISE